MKFRILILLNVLMLVIGCEEPASKKETFKKTSSFRLAKDYSNFSNEIENGNTLSIIVNLSVCMWEEYDLIKFTKRNDETYLQIIKIVELSEDTIKFPKKQFKSNDGKRIEKLISEFDINNKNEVNSPFFVISNIRENDTVLLRTTGLSDRINKVEKYQNIISDLYPQEMKNYKERYQTPPPPPGKTKE